MASERERPDDGHEREADDVSAALMRMSQVAREGPAFDLSGVRIHADEQAARSAHEIDALAYTYGEHVVFGAGQYRPGTDAGRALLAHELVHVAQQRAGAAPRLQAKGKKRKPVRTVTRITLFVDRGIVVLELDAQSTITLPTVYNGRPTPGAYRIRGSRSTPAVDGKANDKDWIVEWNFPPDAEYLRARDYTFHVIAGHPGPSGVAGSSSGEGTGERQRHGAMGAGAASAGGDEEGKGGIGAGSKEAPAKGSPVPDRSGTAATSDTGAAAPRLTPEEEAVWRQMAELMRGAGQPALEEPAELVRLFQVLRQVVVDPQPSPEGRQSWVRFAQFLDKNRDKIEGFLRTSPNGALTQEVLEKIIAEYGKFLAAEPVPKGPDELETREDYDKEFKYDPGWQKLSPADRQLLMEYAHLAPGEIRDDKIDFTRITTEMKVAMALKLADASLLGEMGQAAKNAFTDPKFVITLVVVMAIYVGLWLTPDPSWVTKIAAGALTVALLAQFAIEDIYGFAVAWSDLSDECAAATSVERLKTAGNKFLKRVGPIGFDIMLFLVMWRIGKLAGPKLSRIGAERGTARAAADLKAAEARPGSGVTQPGGSNAAKVLAEARAKASGTSPTQVLDALGKRLPESAADGLANLRAKAGDANALKAVEGQASAGRDLGRFLSERAMSAEAMQAAQAEVSRARLKLARARLIEAETIKDPLLRETVRLEQYESIKSVLRQARALDGVDIKRAIAARDVKGLVRALRDAVTRLGERTSAHKTQGALGESIQRAQLRIKYAGRQGVQFISNLAVVRKLGQYRSIREWTGAEEARIRRAQPGIADAALNKAVSETRVKLFEKNNAVYESLGEVDTLVAEPGAHGKLKPLEVAEAKAGRSSAADANAQLAEVVQAFDKIAAGDSGVRLFERAANNRLGKDMTSSFDLSQTTGIERSTSGPQGRTGFSENLGFTDAELGGVAESLIRNLPPDKPATVAPVTSPRDETEPAR